MSQSSAQPNIIFILADDMGFGDLAANNPASKIPTPHLDRMAANGMRFTDAHAGSSVCTPSRYNILTGRYAWRSQLKSGIVWDYDLPHIEDDRMTVAHLLKEQGYATHCIGKWHLGWRWTTKDGQCAGDQLPFGVRVEKQRHAMNDNIDYTKPLTGGPMDRGFDTHFGVDVPNFPPYTWIDGRQVTPLPMDSKPDDMYGHPGPMAPGWTLEGMLPEFSKRVDAVIENSGDEPFFLYFPLTAPHTPISPNKEFEGASGIGRYGDFVCEVDAVVGRVMETLERTGQLDNTLVIFTSDNGPEELQLDYQGAYNLARETGHRSMGDWRGTKRDVWEGGHRVPYIAHWPATIAAGSTCDQLVCLGDFFATAAGITGTTIPSSAAEDSVSLLPLLQGNTSEPVREYLIHHSANGDFAVRNKEWVLIDAPLGGCNEPDWWREANGYTEHDQPGELFDLANDATEKENCYGSQPEKVAELQAIIDGVKLVGTATNGQLKPLSELSE